jgi:hypothetical protein
MQFWAALKKWYIDGRNISAWPFGELYDRCQTQGAFIPEQNTELAGLVRSWVRKATPAIAFLPQEMAETEYMLRLGGEALATLGETQHLRLELAALRNSTSWRLTAPLRWTVNAGREAAVLLRSQSLLLRYRLRLRTRVKALGKRFVRHIGSPSPAPTKSSKARERQKP